jgi:hypothetical protein
VILQKTVFIISCFLLAIKYHTQNISIRPDIPSRFVFLWFSDRVSAGTSSILTEALRGFPQSLLAETPWTVTHATATGSFRTHSSSFIHRIYCIG